MIEIVSAQKRFVNSDHAVLDRVSLQIQSGEFLSLLGPSGCGKTTLLRILAGLEKPDSGQILFKGQDITCLSPQERPFHMVFQRHALFPHLSVFENVAFGLRLLKMPGSEIESRVREALQLVKMETFRDRRPSSLSGGQSQRVALARALACQPQVILLDEPLSALDLKLRESMQVELRLLQQKLGITFVYVTHDQQEAFAMSDRVAVMNQGHLVQVSDPETLYQRPQSLFVAQFVGAVSCLPVGKPQPAGDGLATASYGANQLKGQSMGEAVTSTVALVRPEAFTTDRRSSEDNSLTGVIRQRVFRGGWVEVQIETIVGHFVSYNADLSQTHRQFEIGSEMTLYFSPERTKFFNQEPT